MSVGIVDNALSGWQCCRRAGAVAVSEPEAVGQRGDCGRGDLEATAAGAGSAAWLYRLAYVRDGRRLIGYDNERGKGDHRHYGEHEEEYRRATLGRRDNGHRSIRAQQLVFFRVDVPLVF
jgi:hypothetical protein